MIYAVIPCYNAAQTLPELLRRLAPVVANAHTICVSDGSTDHTVQVLSAFPVHIIARPHNEGKGAALKVGFEYALRQGASAVLTLDSDLQHSPSDAPKLIAALEHFDMVIGSRHRAAQFRRSPMPFARQLSNRITSGLLSQLLHQPILDSQCGYRIIRRLCLETILPLCKETGYMFETEFLIYAVRRGFRIGFVEIETIYAGEKSYMRYATETKNFLKLVWQAWRQQQVA
ncbi:MAG: glycosyltransferase family 2 protein [Chloroherpetonaceae bacterium]|nr:glycosyltransferase family 2 protein [Chloroherpetonaceae bacterium]